MAIKTLVVSGRRSPKVAGFRSEVAKYSYSIVSKRNVEPQHHSSVIAA
jgi:hypothetical protein